MIASLRAAVQLARPAQWIKNVFVLAALVFGARRGDPEAWIVSLEAFGIFCMLSSAIYAFNDLRDYKEDAHHPTKCKRPVASGALSPSAAGAIAILLAVIGLTLSWRLAPGFLLTAAMYVGINLFYTLWGKQRVLLDVILIALGFVLRALAGAQAIDVPVSAWMVICTFTLCLFLGFGKRRCEIAVMAGKGDAKSHRATLKAYTPELLTHLLSTTGGIAMLTFLLYTLDPATPWPTLIFTTPLVFYAIFRYVMVISLGERTGPTDILINDRPFLITAVMWTLLTMGIVYKGDAIAPYLPQLRYPGTQSTHHSPPTAANPSPER